MLVQSKSKSLLDIFKHNTALYESKPLYRFLITDDIAVEVNYKEFYANTLKVANYLYAEVGIKNSERVLILYPPGMEYLYAFYGCLFSGIIAVPAYPPDYNNIDRITAIIKDCSPKIILADHKVGEKLSKFALINNLFDKIPTIISIPEVSSLEDAPSFNNTSIDQDTIAFLQYTSGSTSNPKGVIISHDNLIANSECIRSGISAQENSQVVSWLPPYHDMGLIGTIIYPFTSGQTSTLMSPMFFIKKPYRWLQAISAIRNSDHIFSPAPNFSYQLCCDKLSNEDVATLNLENFKVAACGAEPIRVNTYEQFYQKFKPAGFKRNYFTPVYGLAEATLVMSGRVSENPPVISDFDSDSFKKNELIASDAAEGKKVSLISCGSIVDNHMAIIVDPETLTKCSPDTVGEIWISGKSIAKGYWGDSSNSDIAFNAFTSDNQEGPFFRTGDLGFLFNDELYISGRLKDCLIINGKNHYPQEIEETVSNVSDVFRRDFAAVFTAEPFIEKNQENLVAIQEIVRKHSITDFSTLFAEVRKAVFLKHNLSIDEIILIEQSSIPKTSSGKIQRNKTKHLFLEGSLKVIARS